MKLAICGNSFSMQGVERAVSQHALRPSQIVTPGVFGTSKVTEFYAAKKGIDLIRARSNLDLLNYADTLLVIVGCGVDRVTQRTIDAATDKKMTVIVVNNTVKKESFAVFTPPGSPKSSPPSDYGSSVEDFDSDAAYVDADYDSADYDSEESGSI